MNKNDKLSNILNKYNISEKDLELILKPKIKYDTEEIHTGSNTEKIAFISDTHLGDKNSDLKSLHQFYRHCINKGVNIVCHSGDILAGVGIYKNQHADLHRHTISDQIEHLTQDYPYNEKITTYLVLGNHDLNGEAHTVDIGKLIQQVRKDIKVIGKYSGYLQVNKLKIALHHGDGGTAYAKSYKLQKLIEILHGDKKPNILSLGHYHTSLQTLIRYVYGLMAGCFQKPTDYTIRKGLPSEIGGWILKINHTNKPRICTVNSEYINF